MNIREKEKAHVGLKCVTSALVQDLAEGFCQVSLFREGCDKVRLGRDKFTLFEPGLRDSANLGVIIILVCYLIVGSQSLLVIFLESTASSEA